MGAGVVMALTMIVALGEPSRAQDQLGVRIRFVQSAVSCSRTPVSILAMHCIRKYLGMRWVCALRCADAASHDLT